MLFRLMTLTAVTLSIGGCSQLRPADGGYDSEAAQEEIAKDVALALPSDYRAFGPYLVADRLNQDDQVIVLYANDVARDGARADGKLPDGSILIGEIYKAKTDADGAVMESALGRRIPNELAAIVMMERQAQYAAAYPEELKVGGWEFEVFSPSGENLARDTGACRECHAPLGDSEFTFSYEHIAGVN